jgi:hypothetical protein
MERDGLTAEAAVSALHRAARDAGVKVLDYATKVVNFDRRDGKG